MQAGIIATVCILWFVSLANNGIATVGDSQNAYFDDKGFHPASLWSSSIVWTTVPAWILSAYSAFWSAMLEVLTDAHRTLGLYRTEQKHLPGSVAFRKAITGFLRQLPFFRGKFQPVRLPAGAKPESTTARMTIMLDYGNWPVLNAAKAIYYGHGLLGLCMLLRAALWAAGGLSAAVFSIATVPFHTPANLSANLFYDEYLGYYSGKGYNLTSALTAMDIVSATLVNNGADYPWTTDTRSFLPFNLDPHLGPGNYTADTETYWATVSCNVVGVEDLERIGAIEVVRDAEDGSVNVYLSYSYAGCDVTKSLAVTNVTLQYAKTFAVRDCSMAAGYLRLGMISGFYNGSDNYQLSNLTVITCQPLFYRGNVSLTVTLGDNSTEAQVLGFEEKGVEQTWPFFMSSWLEDTPLYSVLDPNTFLDLDTFSRLVITHASSNRTVDTGPLPPLKLLDSFGSVFQAYYANFVTLQAYYAVDEMRTVQGTLSRNVLRLFVVSRAEWAVVGIMSFAMLVTIVLTYQMHRNRHILAKHMEPILGDALLFRRNDGLEGYLTKLAQSAEDRAQQTSVDPRTIDLVEYAREAKDEHKEALSSWVVWMDGDKFCIKKQADAWQNGNGIPLNSIGTAGATSQP
ncbi:hypothetical protein NKR23_g336 [Pleurostoma richardsiae]|uniref:Uncharacterized protein n=1 Tax=Pleurostoma richardsiae TaxID=41990 RepID=A0AA38SDI4_9PEZI|nr:hypothetical protein NKR23_g336 [Pleurostoma richardsiae]